MLQTHAKSEWAGNPGRYACFIDESDNGVLATVGTSVHFCTWEKTVLVRMMRAPPMRKRLVDAR